MLAYFSFVNHKLHLKYSFQIPRWTITSAPGTRILLHFDEFYLTYFGSPGCSYEDLKIYSGN